MPSFEQARSTILQHVAPLGIERISLFEAGGRIIAENITAPWNMPRWDNSAMDGFAVRLADWQQSASLPVQGYIPAGGTAEQPIAPGTAIRIMTGAPIPPGADAVIPIEETEENNGRILIHGQVKKDQHIRFAAEDIRAGECIIPAGTQLRPAEIGMLASFSKVFVPVYRRARVAILSTGDELVEPGETIGTGQIINSDSMALAAAIRDIGAEPVFLGIARDTRESHLVKLAEGLKADALITSAGVSAGDRDLVREILGELGVRPVFWKIDIKPGRPTAFAMHEATPVFSLPGNPVSTMITFEELVRPALLRMMGHRRVIKPTVKAVLTEPVSKKSGRLHFLRVQIQVEAGRYLANPSGDQNTGILKTMIRAGGLALLPAQRDRFEAGEVVDVHLLGGGIEMLEE